MPPSSSAVSSSVVSSSIPSSSSVVISSVASSSIPSSSSAVVSSVVSSLVPSSSSVVISSFISSLIPSSSAPTSSTPVSSSSSVIETCGGNQCFAAVTAEPAIGESFCSSWLSQTPETTVITETATATSTHTSLETATTLLTLTTATTTVITGSTTHFLKRLAASSVAQISSAPAPSATILSQCASDNDRVSSACSCYLSTTSTVTVYETATSTVVAEVASTVIAPSTTKVIATVEALATQTVQAQPIVNAGLESYLASGNLLPWTDSVSSTGGQMQIINGVNPCSSNNGVVECAGGQVVVRAYPPNTAARYVSLKQTFLAKPSRTYSLSFLYRCLNYDANTKIEVWYAGQRVGSTANCFNSAAFFRPTGGIQFTTDATGRGEIEIRFVSSGATPYLYFYADDFKATLV
ncbi:hypothetical protein QBC37DRAFT_290617 [Rhypophila decipiens]|uniref:CBM-cenC domain-containing protein n=1 Tax=Rhypophila decipiens TaxID=261697 RepID=A0AAN7B5R0_9PEZI|nr:hypothetical protein QBC37DRAFT_290617 [Rhypophila decipiens]